MTERLKDSITLYIGTVLSVFVGVIGLVIAICIILAIMHSMNDAIGALFAVSPIVSRQRLITLKSLKKRISKAKRLKNNELFDVLNFAEKHMAESRKVYDVEIARKDYLTFHSPDFLADSKIHARRRSSKYPILKDSIGH